jgi:predicted CoA-binding protein
VLSLKIGESIEEFVCKPSKIAVVGASQNRNRPVYGVMTYLKRVGFNVYPVNPSLEGKTLLDLPCYGRLSDVPEKVDIVALFLSSKRQDVVLEDLRRLPYRPIVWMQPGAENDEAKERLERDGYDVVKGACLMATHQVYCALDKSAREEIIGQLP